MKKSTLLIVLISFSLYSTVLAQSNRWKRMRYEVFTGLGASNFLGELGGANKVGTDYLADLEFSMTRPAFNAGIRYKLFRRVAVQSSLTYAILRGDDAKTEEPYRQNRNLHFRSPLAEFGVRLEYSVLVEKKGSRYSLRKVRGRAGNKFNIDVFAGGAVFFFNPKAQNPFTQEWYALQPIGTEGQNFVETRKPYSRFNVAIPVGINIKYQLNRKWSVGWEFGMRQTFTDYIDDVSTTYVSSELVGQHSGISPIIASQLADPSLGVIDGATAINQQRGNPYDNDVYMFSFINLNYKLRTGRNGLPRF